MRASGIEKIVDPERGLVYRIAMGEYQNGDLDIKYPDIEDLDLNEYLDIEDLGLEDLYVEDNGSMLRCSACNAFRCRHVDSVIQLGIDGAYLLDFESAFFVPITPALEVDCIVTPDDVVRVSFSYHDPEVGLVAQKIDLLGPLIESGLGRLRPGEGRRVVRDLVINYMAAAWGIVDSKDRDCTRRSHGVAAQKAVNRAAEYAKQPLPDLTYMYEEIWSMLSVGQCVTCRKITQELLEKYESDLPRVDRIRKVSDHNPHDYILKFD